MPRITGVVTPLLYTHIKKIVRDDFQRGGHFHPSALARDDFCPCSWVLRNYHPDAPAIYAEAVELQSARRFANGNAMHRKIQEWLGGMGVLWGHWKRVGTRVEERVGFPPAENGFHYEEIEVYHLSDRITGRIDGLIRVDGKKWGLEFKSISPYVWDQVEQNPLGEHVDQVLIYMHCLLSMHEAKRRRASAGFVDEFDARALDGFILLYENSDTLALREFEVRLERRAIDKLMGQKRLVMEEALDYERTRELPPCRCQQKNRAFLCTALGKAPFEPLALPRSAATRPPKSRSKVTRERKVESDLLRKAADLGHDLGESGAECARCGRSAGSIESHPERCLAATTVSKYAPRARRSLGGRKR